MTASETEIVSVADIDGLRNRGGVILPRGRPAAEAEREAAKAGIDFRALKDLKRRLKIESRRVQPPGVKARWEWWTRTHSTRMDPLLSFN
jgi:hypothetical protein